MSQILYPKPIAPLDKQTLPNEIGFTTTEIAALQNGWRLIKRRIYYHSRKIFMDFFQEYDPLLNRFREPDGKLSMSHLHQHPMAILVVYGSIIENGLGDTAYVNILLSDVSKNHRAYGVTYDEIKLLTDHILGYILQYLEKVISSNFVSGLIKLSDLLNSYHIDKSQGNDADTDYGSDRS